MTRRWRHLRAQWADSLAHFLYCPTMLGRRAARARWHHRLHLIPGFLLAKACDAYDRSLGVTEAEMHSTGRARVEIDPNVRLGRDRTFVGFEDVHGIIAPGMEVDVFSGNWLAGTATVDEVNQAARLVYLRLDWSSLVFNATSAGSSKTVHARCPDGCTTMSLSAGKLVGGVGACGEPFREAP